MKQKRSTICEKCGINLTSSNQHPNRNFCERCWASASIEPQRPREQLSLFDLQVFVENDIQDK